MLVAKSDQLCFTLSGDALSSFYSLPTSFMITSVTSNGFPFNQRTLDQMLRWCLLVPVWFINQLQ